MKRSLLFSASVASFLVASQALAGPAPSAPLPSLPGSAPSESARSSAPAGAGNAVLPGGAPLSPQQLYEHIRRGIVAIERNGVPLALGTVLDGDGRILTSWSGLGGADAADVRYADGSTAHTKVGNSDKATDLALLVPQTGKWTEGLSASESDPVGAPLRAILPGHGPRLAPTEVGVKGRVDAHARDGTPIDRVLDVDVKGPVVAGAPLLDAAGSVVGVLVRECKGPAVVAQPASMPWAAWATSQDPAAEKAAAPPCIATVVGAPVAAIRSFLAKTPATAVAPTPWLGIRGETAESGAVHGVRVMAVAPSSPAQKAGLRPEADIIVAADGRPIDTPETLGSTIGKHAPGDTVKLLVYGDDKFREVPVALRAAP
ncbi:MAG TPA: PDZ domain-containing protein [Polyangiaceae bacterium]